MAKRFLVVRSSLSPDGLPSVSRLSPDCLPPVSRRRILDPEDTGEKRFLVVRSSHGLSNTQIEEVLPRPCTIHPTP